MVLHGWLKCGFMRKTPFLQVSLFILLRKKSLIAQCFIWLWTGLFSWRKIHNYNVIVERVWASPLGILWPFSKSSMFFLFWNKAFFHWIGMQGCQKKLTMERDLAVQWWEKRERSKFINDGREKLQQILTSSTNDKKNRNHFQKLLCYRSFIKSLTVNHQFLISIFSSLSRIFSFTTAMS